MRDLNVKTTEAEVCQYFNTFLLNLPGAQYAKVDRINSSYKMEEYEAQLAKVRALKSQIKLLSIKETSEMKREFLANKAAHHQKLETEAQGHKAATTSEDNSPDKKTNNSIQKHSVEVFKVDETKFSPEYRKLLKEFDLENKALETLKTRITTTERQKYFNGICFVTFETKQMADKIISLVGTHDGWIRRLCFCFSNKKIRMNQKTNFTLKAAHNPSDVNWQNLEAGAWQALCSRVATFGLSFVLIVISFFIQLGLKLLQKSMTESLQGDPSLSFSSVSFRLISAGVAFVILVINTAISMALQMLTLKEKQTTNTTFFRSLTIKICWFQFINTNILIVIIHLILFYPNVPLWAKGGLMNDAWFILLSQIVVTPVLNVFNIWYFLALWRQSKLRKSVENGTAEDLTQIEAHTIYELPVWDPAFGYADIVKDIMTCIFFQPLLPISGFMGVVSIFLMYWSQKYRFLFMSVRPMTISTHIAKTVLHLLSFGPLVYGVAAF